MQDQRYDQLREILGANAEKGIDERFKELLRNNKRDFNEMMEVQRDLEPKYVIVKEGELYRFRARYVDMHRTLLSQNEIRQRLCDGGGFWGVDGEKRLVTLYDSSSDFGFPKHIEEAIHMDGWHLLEILGRVCDKKGGLVDLSGYQISYMDRQHERHYVDYRFTCDGRIADSYYYASALKCLKYFMKNPVHLELPPESIEDDIN